MNSNLFDDLKSQLGGGWVPCDPVSLQKFAADLHERHHVKLEAAQEAIGTFCRTARKCCQCENWQLYGDVGDRCLMCGGEFARPAHLEAIARATASDREAFDWARQQQGFTGTYADWQALDDGTRKAYEDGAAGIGTA